MVARLCPSSSGIPNRRATRLRAPASRAWLHRSLVSLASSSGGDWAPDLSSDGDTPEACLAELIEETGAGAVTWNRVYEPSFIARDTGSSENLLDAGLEVRSFNGSLLFAPNRVETKSGGPFKVFTPFWKHCLKLPVRPVIPFEADRLAGR